MFDVTNFLMRWLFLGNLVRDIAEIQNLPYNPYPNQANNNNFPPHMLSAHQREEQWRDESVRAILMYPSGPQRQLVIDAMRANLVDNLCEELSKADALIDRYITGRMLSNENKNITIEESILDADPEIFRVIDELRGGPSVIDSNTSPLSDINGTNKMWSKRQLPPAGSAKDRLPSDSEVQDAQETVHEVRNYLPQLVSAVLKSPTAFDPSILNPIKKLRQLLVQRCVEDANWGIDMCWLLEAEVGRAWKNLFEHRQQTGRRLIVVLPAEKAAVLAKIGSEKKEAFDFLQDAEQATAYGYTNPFDGDEVSDSGIVNPDTEARLLSSLSLRRCSHFGDTMHFIDRMTRISLDLRRIPTIHRHAYLHESMREINRRLRRRMVTRGDVSLDVEDNRNADDWPRVQDVSEGMIRYSIHLPLDPLQSPHWPGGLCLADATDGGVVRVLNIVEDECRLLSSRERCPYLVRLEVAETGLRGNDARLFAAGAPGLGATVEEALGIGMPSSAPNSEGAPSSPYRIPTELLASIPIQSRKVEELPHSIGGRQTDKWVPRGGWNADDDAYYGHGQDVVYGNPYDDFRQAEYQRLHQQMHVEHDMQELQLQGPIPQQSFTVSTRDQLLDNVFGRPLVEKCEEIRQASPYGKVEGWRLASFIMKAGEDIRREALVMQVIAKLNRWFASDIPESIRPHMRPYTIMCVGGDAGLVECLADAKSIDEVKKKTDSFQSLRDYFERAYGPPTNMNTQLPQQGPSLTTRSGTTFAEAQENFLRSLVGYSLVCYILQIKDRHNANILLDRNGHIIHIDFGFVLGDTPKMGKVPIFSERAPFKLSGEFWDVLGGWNLSQGGLGVRFCQMFERAFECASEHAEEIVSLVEATMLTLVDNARTARFMANGVRNRLRMRGAPGSVEQKTFIMELINTALTSWGTSTYDWLQKSMNGYQ